MNDVKGNEWLALACWLYCLVGLVVFSLMTRSASPLAEPDVSLCPLCDRPVRPSRDWPLHPAS